MQIKMVGTGAVYTKYNSACILVDEKLLVDAPNGILKQLLKDNNDLKKMNTILITHMHGDHTADILFILVYLNIYLKLKKKVTIVGPTGLYNKLLEIERALNFIKHDNFKDKYCIDVIELKDKEELTINKYKIKAYKVEHGHEKPCLGYVINDTLGITGDSTLCKGVETIVSTSKITVSDCSHINASMTHMGIYSNKQLVEKYNKKIIATHMRDETRKKLLELKIDNIIVPNDFDVIDII